MCASELTSSFLSSLSDEELQSLARISFQCVAINVVTQSVSDLEMT